jgi:hypothetical protein
MTARPFVESVFLLRNLPHYLEPFQSQVDLSCETEHNPLRLGARTMYRNANRGCGHTGLVDQRRVIAWIRSPLAR